MCDYLLKGEEVVHSPILQQTFTVTLDFVRSYTPPGCLLSGLSERDHREDDNTTGTMAVFLFWHHYIPVTALLAQMTMNSSMNDSVTFINLM